MSAELHYEHFLATLSKEQWKRIGIKRRSGVAVPLFSIYSSHSVGIGELPDLRLLVDWCRKAGMSLIQLLPMNDVDFNFRPYDAQSTFALEPMYLSLDELTRVEILPFKEDIKKIKQEFPAGSRRVNYKIKSAKLSLLWKIFETCSLSDESAFEAYVRNNAFWLENYALFKVIKENNNGMAWEGWSEDLKHKKEDTILSLKETYKDNLTFHKWLQWQLFEQFKRIKEYATSKNVLLVGDLPFLVSRDSADVWSHQEYFKLALSSGAPPDMLFGSGQRWGMPPYHWENIANHNYDYLIEKLKYAQNFYDIYRIDHVVGNFRVWTVPLSEPLEHSGLHGAFDPKEESDWEEHGRKLLSVMIKNTSMLACAEDLGTIPDCSFKVLEEFGVPGIDVQRWMRKWQKTYDFKDPSEYRKNSLGTIGTHDMSNLCAWWEYEAGTVDEGLFKRKCKEKDIPFEIIKDKLFDPERSSHGRLRWRKEIQNEKVLLDILSVEESRHKDLIDLYKGSFDEKAKFLRFLDLEEEPQEKYPALFVKRALEKISHAASIFSIQLLHDWLSLDSLFTDDPWEVRINFPGTLSEKNWTLVMPVSLEDLLVLPINAVIKTINEESDRC